MNARRLRVEKKTACFGQRLKRARLDRGLTQQALESMTGIHRVTISDYEVGPSLPGLFNALLLADALNVDLKWLLKGATE